jgi:hypothetical protein
MSSKANPFSPFKHSKEDYKRNNVIVKNIGAKGHNTTSEELAEYKCC